MDREKILEVATQFISNDRNASYDEPERNFTRIAQRWNLTLENAFKRGYVEPYEVALMLIDVKLARIVTSPQRIDHWVDLAGYSACGGELAVPNLTSPSDRVAVTAEEAREFFAMRGNGTDTQD